MVEAGPGKAEKEGDGLLLAVRVLVVHEAVVVDGLDVTVVVVVEFVPEDDGAQHGDLDLDLYLGNVFVKES